MRSIVLMLAGVIFTLLMPAAAVHAEELEPAAAEEGIYDIAMLQTGYTDIEQTPVIPGTEAVPELAAEDAALILEAVLTNPEFFPAPLTESGSAWNGSQWVTTADFPWLMPAEYEALKSQLSSRIWAGEVLNRYDGINYGPSGKESYYNLDMSLVVANMHAMGFAGEYWVRDDGVKMFGPYIMCAANLSVHPRGSLVESSLGTCIVCDTGSFAYRNPNMLDIAVSW